LLLLVSKITDSKKTLLACSIQYSTLLE